MLDALENGLINNMSALYVRSMYVILLATCDMQSAILTYPLTACPLGASHGASSQPSMSTTKMMAWEPNVRGGTNTRKMRCWSR